MENVTLLFVCNGTPLTDDQQTYYKQLMDSFADVIGVIREEAGADWMQGRFSDTVSYTSKEGKVSALNKAVAKVRTSFSFILESDESCTLSRLNRDISGETCYRALIDIAGKKEQRNYQVRLFPSPQGDTTLFDGFAVPDLNRGFHRHGWEMAEEVIPIQKADALFKPADAKAEAEQNKDSQESLFWQAILGSSDQKFNQAEQKFRKVLKNDQLLEFHYLAALNGLANALVEQHKLEEAGKVAKQSIGRNRRQRSPYLTLYKVHKLSGHTEKAYECLNNYLQAQQYASLANLDVSLPVSECHFLMADTAFKQGDYDRAFYHYEWYYDYHKGEVSLPVLEKLFIYAIELQNYKKSVCYFNDLFGDHIPDKLTDEMSARLLESLSLFMDNGWYDFVSGVYKELVEHNPGDNQLLNKWISTLIKNKEIAKAQELLGRKKVG